MTMQDRRKGALYGQAIGDALGAFYEFSGNLGPGESARYRSSRNDGFLEGEWTDDTEQAFILLRAFTEEPEDQDLAALILAEGLQNWLHNDGRGCGNHTAKVLTDGVYGIAPLVVSEDVWVQSGKESAPNGGVMRAVGVPVVRPWDPAWVIQAATLGCQVTHWDPRCVASAVAVSVACAALIRGEGIPSAVQQGIDAGKAIEPGIAEYLTMSLDKLQLRGPGIGYTYKCAGSGFWALREFQREAAEVEEMTPPGNSAEENWGLQFESILNDIIREQGDTDTNAAVAGAVMGSYIGFENLPKHLVEGLQNKGTLDALLATLPEAP